MNILWSKKNINKDMNFYSCYQLQFDNFGFFKLILQSFFLMRYHNIYIWAFLVLSKFVLLIYIYNFFFIQPNTNLTQYLRSM